MPNYITLPDAERNSLLKEPADAKIADPVLLAVWKEIHELIAALPPEEREVFNLHWYHGMTQEETAAIVGVNVKTIKRRWLAAKVRLGEKLDKACTE